MQVKGCFKNSKKEDYFFTRKPPKQLNYTKLFENAKLLKFSLHKHFETQKCIIDLKEIIFASCDLSENALKTIVNVKNRITRF